VHARKVTVLCAQNLEYQSRISNLQVAYEAQIHDLSIELDESVRSEVVLESNIDSMIQENAKLLTKKMHCSKVMRPNSTN